MINYKKGVDVRRLTNSDKEILTLSGNEVYWLKVYFKLKEYEDLEEQGKLLKLLQDKVYYIVDKNTPKFATIMSKSIRDLTIYEVENIDIDERYFSTEKLAEAKLKELRGEENGN